MLDGINFGIAPARFVAKFTSAIVGLFTNQVSPAYDLAEAFGSVALPN